eukprot:1867628-Prymnesium_polylepis.1
MKAFLCLLALDPAWAGFAWMKCTMWAPASGRRLGHGAPFVCPYGADFNGPKPITTYTHRSWGALDLIGYDNVT